MEKGYLEQMDGWTVEEVADSKYFIEGNEHTFWVAVKLFTMAESAIYSVEMSNKIFDMAVREIEGLQFVGYMDRAHKTVLATYGIQVDF